MRIRNTHSKTSLFLIEMIISLLFLAIACTGGVQIFAAAHKDRQTARELNHIQELTSTAGELLEGCDGYPETVLSLMPEGQLDGDTIHCYYDKAWQSCSPSDAVYTMEIVLQRNDSEKKAAITFYHMSGNELYHLTVRFPVLKIRGEAKP